jgi:hypothetical protein
VNVITRQITPTLRLFESLGDDGELSLVQRLAGLDQPPRDQRNRLRIETAPMDVLLAALSDDFADLVGPGRLPLTQDHDGQMIMATRDGLRARLTAFNGIADAGVGRYAAALRRTLLDDLADGRRIWVRKGADTDRDSDARTLLSALRRHGPNHLLWVLPQAETHPAGSVAVLEDGLLCGRVSHFARDQQRLDVCVDDWLELCQGARLLTLVDAAPGEVRRPSRAHVPANLLPGTAAFDGPWWQRDAVAASARDAAAPPPPEPDSTVMTHRLTASTDESTACLYGHCIESGLQGGASHVASLWVNIPHDFDGDIVGMVCDGYDSAHLANADLTRRDVWQRAWVRTRIPGNMSAGNPSLYVIGHAGSVVHTACWKLELGFMPTDWRRGPRLA